MNFDLNSHQFCSKNEYDRFFFLKSNFDLKYNFQFCSIIEFDRKLIIIRSQNLVYKSFDSFQNMDWTRAMERILKLAVSFLKDYFSILFTKKILNLFQLPNHLIWLTFFYLLFHSFLNTMGEILSFADRNFYNDWWNSDDIVVFWKTWNLPVHRWAVSFVQNKSSRYSNSTFQITVSVLKSILFSN